MEVECCEIWIEKNNAVPMKGEYFSKVEQSFEYSIGFEPYMSGYSASHVVYPVFVSNRVAY